MVHAAKLVQNKLVNVHVKWAILFLFYTPFLNFNRRKICLYL